MSACAVFSVCWHSTESLRVTMTLDPFLLSLLAQVVHMLGYNNIHKLAVIRSVVGRGILGVITQSAVRGVVGWLQPALHDIGATGH